MPPREQRPFGTGAFFDYVVDAAREQARRSSALRAVELKEQVTERRSSSAKERWEGEGGNTAAATPRAAPP
jgi:hypothetical protein